MADVHDADKADQTLLRHPSTHSAGLFPKLGSGPPFLPMHLTREAVSEPMLGGVSPRALCPLGHVSSAHLR